MRSPSGKITTFDAPDGVGSTFVCEETCLNPEGAVAGYYADVNGVRHGFVREPDGKITEFSAPGAGTSAGQGGGSASITALGVITGYFFDSDNVPNGFVRTPDGKLTTFNVSGSFGYHRLFDQFVGYGHRSLRRRELRFPRLLAFRFRHFHLLRCSGRRPRCVPGHAPVDQQPRRRGRRLGYHCEWRESGLRLAAISSSPCSLGVNDFTNRKGVVMKKIAIAGLVLIASMVLGSSGWAQSEGRNRASRPTSVRTVTLTSRVRSPGHSQQHRQLCRVVRVQAAPRVSPRSARPGTLAHARRTRRRHSRPT